MAQPNRKSKHTADFKAMVALKALRGKLILEESRQTDRDPKKFLP